MRILVVGLNFAPELTGVGKYSGEMAAWLARRGHDVAVVTTRPYYPQWTRASGLGRRAGGGRARRAPRDGRRRGRGAGRGVGDARACGRAQLRGGGVASWSG